jgi:hypothetical protein
MRSIRRQELKRARWLAAAATVLLIPQVATAQQPQLPSATGNATPFQFDPATIPGSNTTEVPRATDGLVQVRLIALLTDDGQKIDRDVVWRVFKANAGEGGKSALIDTLRNASPDLKLPPGDYFVNAAFGRANFTRKISLTTATPADTVERFVLNAGGLRVTTAVSGQSAANSPPTFSIFSDRDQGGDRKLIMSGVKPGLMIRLNSGIYQVVSSVGDANAIVSSDVTVEAGKLTEATVTHTAAKATFKLVSRPGGEAIAGTQWVIQNQQGAVVKESSGALPTHILAPGSYTAVAKSQGKSQQRAFTLKDGDTTQVEVLLQ